ncbi:MAG: phosphoribosylanthranilate isomerase [Balneolales bacterium]|nr:phosphoribosylanthranilate isomerase [Balneolales bacterium]
MYLEDKRTRIKICGLTRLEDCRFASGALVDYLGFIFVESSPRYIEPEKAAELINWVEGPKCVGVFRNLPAPKVNAMALESGVHLVQLHGEESPEYCAEIQFPVIKAFRIKADMDRDSLMEMIKPYRDHVEYFLFDSYDPKMAGGTGKTFNWNVLRELPEDYPFFLAGGLSKENVRRAIHQLQPYAVDLSSSVEESPGVKDFELLDELMEEMREIWDEQELA